MLRKNNVYLINGLTADESRCIFVGACLACLAWSRCFRALGLIARTCVVLVVLVSISHQLQQFGECLVGVRFVLITLSCWSSLHIVALGWILQSFPTVVMSITKIMLMPKQRKCQWLWRRQCCYATLAIILLRVFAPTQNNFPVTSSPQSFFRMKLRLEYGGLGGKNVPVFRGKFVKKLLNYR